MHCGATNPLAWLSLHRVAPRDCWCATTTRPPNKVANTRRRKPIKRLIPTRSYLPEQSRGTSRRSGQMRCEVEKVGCKIEGEGGAGWQWVTLCSASLEVAVGKGICSLQAPMERRCLSRTQKSSNQNLFYREMSTRSGSNLVLRIPINFYSYTCNYVY